MGSKPRRSEDQADAAEVSIEEALRRYLEQAPLPFAVTRGPEHRLVYANAAFGHFAKVAAGVPVGAPITAAFGGAPGRALHIILDRSFRDGAALTDVPIGALGERGTDLHVSVWPVIGDHGLPDALGVELRESAAPDPADDLQRQVAEQMLLGALRERGLAEDAEDARRRAAFLAEAGRLLAESVDQTSTLLALTKLALPILGAWCIVDIINESGAPSRLGIYHSDPEKQKLARELVATWVPDPLDPFGAPAMLREARAIVITEGVEGQIAAAARSEDNLARLRELGIGPMLTVPLLARNKLLGAITFVSAQPGFVYSPEDVQLAEDLAARGGLALDNAQVHEMALVMQRSAETANRAKTAFLGAMSHELRTPLNAIGGYIDLLDMGLRGPVTEQQRADFARVKSSQQHLALLITEILNFARVGSGRVTYAVHDVNGRDAIQRAIELIEPLFGKQGLVFDGISGDSSLVARADPERVTQILVNLLSNAIKFTPVGGHVSADCAGTVDTVDLSVSDTGIGIGPEKLEVIFEPFIQLMDGLSERESGVGLGLAISRDLARAMSGDLTVESTVGKGARFTLSLPRAK
jgi:signal transduction histidine kinase